MPKRREWLAQGGVLFLMLCARACAFGIEYWPQLDDYIQYYSYIVHNASIFELQQKVGVLASRPLAGLADYYIWGRSFEHLIVSVFLISALYCLSALLLRRILSRYVQVGPAFMVIMTLIPLGIEGTYWVSASSRIVVGMFFACLAAMAFGWWLDQGKLHCALVFMAATLLPFGFYEQAAILAMTLVLGMGILELKKRRWRAALAAWSFPAAALYFVIVRFFDIGTIYGSRMELVLPRSAYYWETFLPGVLEQIRTVFLQGNIYTLAKGFLRSMAQVFSGELLGWCLLVFLLSTLLGWMVWREWKDEKARPGCLALVSGFLLALAPTTLFFVIPNTWFSFRCATMSIPGIALFCDGLILMAAKYLPGHRVWMTGLTAMIAFVCCVAGASEIGDYKATYHNDVQVSKVILQALERDGLMGEENKELRIGFLGIEANSLSDQNYFWHEHIHGCTESAWALSGVLNWLADAEDIRPQITPLPTNPVYRVWNAGANNPALFDRLYWYDGKDAEEIILRQTGEKTSDVLFTDGTLLGYLEEIDGIGWFRLS